MNIKERAHRFLFPDFVKKYANMEYENIRLEQKIKRETEIGELKPTMADLMRESLNLITIDFSSAREDGLPRHFLDTDDKQKRSTYITQLASIWQMEGFQEMVKNHIDTQGNKSIRLAADDFQVWAGRFSINGISLIRNEVKAGYETWIEETKPKKDDPDFDPHQLDEGIIISDNEEEK